MTVLFALILTFAPAGDGDSPWDDVAECESGGNWSEGGGGYDGGLQFSDVTWDAMGGEEFASSADQATREQQIIVAERTLAVQGPGAWPNCGGALRGGGGGGGDSSSGDSGDSGSEDSGDDDGDQSLPVTR